MQKKILTIALASLGAFAFQAHADTETTLWGIFDGAFQHASNQGGKATNNYASGDQQSNRWGINATDDIGGGMKALVHLEAGLNGDGTSNGGTAIFGRQLFFGLSKDGAGTLTMGRQFDTIADYVTAKQIVPYGNVAGYGWSVGDLDNMANSIRYNNSFKYTTPVFGGGIKASVMAGLSNKGQGLTDNRMFSAGIGKNAGDLQWGAAFLNVDHPGDANTAGSVDTNTWTSKGFRNNASGTDRWRVALVTVKDKLTPQLTGNATVGQTRYDYNDGTNVKLNELDLGLSYHLTPKLAPFAGYNYVKGSGTTTPKYNTLMVGADYALSKRTDVYVDLGYQKSGGGVNADLFTLAPSSTNTQSVTAAGLRVKF